MDSRIESTVFVVVDTDLDFTPYESLPGPCQSVSLPVSTFLLFCVCLVIYSSLSSLELHLSFVFCMSVNIL
jgi:hypothetical protein